MKFTTALLPLLALAATSASGNPLVSRAAAADAAATAATGAGTGANGFKFCNGQTPTNGLQLKGGSCSTTVQGQLPTFDNMVSTIIVSPKNGETIAVNKPFTVAIQNQNLITGFFDDPVAQYYAKPQILGAGGKIKGHQHITIQQLTSTKIAPDARVFAFFKGLNDAANGQGQLSVLVDKGLPASGLYRVCSISASQGHQPVVMPVAQRGAQDDCVRINVK